MLERLIFHIDVNSAFLSWTSVKRLSEGKSDLRLIPAVIGGAPDRRTSVVLAKSLPAKKFNIHTGEPMSAALKKCPSLVVAPPDFDYYHKSSHRFINMIKEYAPVVEQVSIDECFADFTGTSYIYPDPLAQADEIRERVKKELGFTVNVGLAHNKLLAKMASDFEKPDKTHTLFEDEIEKKMWPLPVGDLLFVGRSSALTLNSNGIHTIGDLAHADISVLKRLLGEKEALSLKEFASGKSDSPVLLHPEESKGYSVMTTFEEDIVTPESAYEVLLDLTNEVSYRMRFDGWRARVVGVRIRSGNYSVRVNRTHQRTLDNATDSTAVIFKNAKELFDELWDKKTGLRLIGIFLTNITKEKNVQLSLFKDEKADEKEEKAEEAMDMIRRKFGIDSIRLGAGKISSRKSREDMK